MEKSSAVLVVSPSWKQNSKGSTTWELISDFCEKTLGRHPSELSGLYCTILDVEVSEKLKGNASHCGVILIPATKYKWYDPVEDPPVTNWLLHHQIYYPELGKLENIGHVVGLFAKTRLAASAIQESIFPRAKFHLLDSKPGALFVADAWNKDGLGLTAFHRTLVQDFCARKANVGEALQVYSTVLDVQVHDEQKVDAESCGVTLIPAQVKEWAIPIHKLPELKWLHYHEIHYPDLSELENIQYVIGYAPKTGIAAVGIQKKLFPKAKLVLINHACPESNCLREEEYDLLEFEDDMLRMASAADLIFSIGPKIHQYFQNNYRVEVEGKDLSEIPAEEILPSLNNDFQSKSPSKLKDLTQHNILTFGQMETQEAVRKCWPIATAISTAAKDRKTCNVNLPKWKLQGTHQEVFKSVKELFAGKKHTSQIEPILYQDFSAKPLLKSLQQAHLCIPTPFYTDYSFHGLEAMVFGLPTFLLDNSDVAHFIKKYFPIYGDTWIVEKPEKNLAKKILQHLANTPLAFDKAKALKEKMRTSDVISASYATFASLLKSKKRTEDVTKDQELKRDEKDSVEIQIELDPTVYPHNEADEQVKATWQSCQQAMKRKVQEVVHNGDGCQVMKKICKDKLGDVNLSSYTTKSLALLLQLLSLYNLYRLKQTCRSGGLAKAFEPLLITEEMRRAAAEVGITLRLKATFDQNRFKEVELFFINRDGGGIQPMIICDDIPTESDETEKAQKSSDEGEVSYVQEHLRDIPMDDHHEQDKQPTKVLLFGVYPAHELKPSTETVIHSLFNAEKCTRQKGKYVDMLKLVVKMTHYVQDMLSSRQEVLALTGVTSYYLADTGTEDLTSLADMEERLMRDGTELLSLPVSDENVSLLARSLLPFQMSEIKVMEYLVEKLLAQINETALPQSVLQHQLDDVRREKATLEEQIKALTNKIESADKSLMNKFTSELEEKKKTINDLNTKLYELQQKQSESKIQDVEDTKTDHHYSKSKEKENVEKLSVKEFLQDSGNNGKRSWTSTATPTQPDRTSKEERKMNAATATTQKTGSWSRRIVKGRQGEKGFKTICSLAFHDDQILVCDIESHDIQTVKRDYTCENKMLILKGSFVGLFVKPIKPVCVAVSWDNLCFILDDNNSKIVVCNHTHNIIRVISLPVDTKPSCIALVKGFVVVTEVIGHRILKYSQNGEYIAEVGSQGDGPTQFNKPFFVAVNSSNVIMVSDYWNHCIKCFDTEFNYLYQFGQPGRSDGQLFGPFSIAVDCDDNVYVCDHGNDRISMWSRDGMWKCHLFQDEVRWPWCMAVTANGDRIAVIGGSLDEVIVFSK